MDFSAAPLRILQKCSSNQEKSSPDTRLYGCRALSVPAATPENAFGLDTMERKMLEGILTVTIHIESIAR